MRYRESTARTKFDSEYRILPEKQCGTERVPSERLARPISQACTRVAVQELDTILRKASEARVDRRLRRYYLIVLLLPTVFTLACLPLSSI